MKRIVVTGANGFIGNVIVHQLQSQGFEILAISRSIPDFFSLPGIKSVKIDFDNIENLPEKLHDKDDEWDVWIHLAWRGTYGQSRRDSDVQLQNLLDFKKCISVAKAIGCKRFVGIGSIMEIEHIMDTKTGEKYAQRGDYVYALAKNMSHAILFSQAEANGMDAIWCTLTNVYGVGDRSDRLINYVLNTILDGKEPVFSNAKQMYDFVYVTDAASAIITCALEGNSFEEYFIGSGQADSLRSFLEVIRNTLAPFSVFHYGALTTGGPNLPSKVFSIKKMQEQFNWCPKVTFKNGIKSLYNWLKKERELNE